MAESVQPMAVPVFVECVKNTTIVLISQRYGILRAVSRFILLMLFDVGELGAVSIADRDISYRG